MYTHKKEFNEEIKRSESRPKHRMKLTADRISHQMNINKDIVLKFKG